MPVQLRSALASCFCATLLCISTLATGTEPPPRHSQEPPPPDHASPAPSRGEGPAGGLLPPGPNALVVDAHSSGSPSNLNGVLDPGETVLIEPAYFNPNLSSPIAVGGTASNFIGPSGATYSILDSAANYGIIDALTVAFCSDCYVLSVDNPATRPAAHWDATFDEDDHYPFLNLHTWTLHIGGSFADAPADNLFYPFIENVFHNGITGGCGGGGYCPANGVTRAQMAVFLLKSSLGASYVPPAATGMIFGDVLAGDFAADWIEDLYNRGITGGCGGGNYCPGDVVTREQMAVFLLKAKNGSSYTPPGCASVFTDVTCPSLFADWIEELYTENVTGGCSTSPLLYCPANPNSRGQMAVFLVKTFGLRLYRP